MKASRLAVLALAGAFALPALAHAQPVSSTTASYTFQFNGTNNAGITLSNGTIVGPYQAHQTAPIIGNTFDLFCIDYDNHISTGQVWQARVVRFADILNNTNGAGDAARNALGLGAASITKNQLNLSGYLADQLQGPQGQWLQAHGELWRIFSNSSDLSSFTNPSSDLNASGKGVLNFAPPNDLVNYDMIIDERAYAGLCSNASGVSTGACTQTFIIQGTVNDRITTPEPGTYALMGAGLLALGVAGRRRRRTA